MPLTCLTRNHTNTPLELRETLHFPENQICGVLKRLYAEDGVDECALLCTCNRTELYLVTSPDADLEGLTGLLGRLGNEPTLSSSSVGILHSDAAVRHLFRVAAGLESLVLGENEILGQVKSAYRLACQAQTNGYFINETFHRAFRVGKRVRNETSLCQGSTSVGTVAVAQAEEELGGFDGRRVLIVGAGEVAHMVARGLRTRFQGPLTICSRSSRRAEPLAREFSADAAAIEDLPELLPLHDVVFSATASPNYVLTPTTFAAVDADEPLVIYDLALPRDVDPAAGALAGVTVHNLDAIQPRVTRTLAEREREVPRAEAVVEEALSDYQDWRKELAAVPSIRRLLEIAEQVRAAETNRLRDLMNPSDVPVLERGTHRMLQNLMKAIVDELKRTARDAVDSHTTGDFARLLSGRTGDRGPD
jgi:glutamyl-tRNA reductase